MGSHQQTTKMGEGSKQVRVDNWGIFFLQRLQMFFNKTDYCDLTLQFEGNVQLKVHRLVMNACTEYFQILEQTCEMIDDVLIMPSDLQADVVLPIVNFMYTGMLEFHMSIYDKLYKTANLMNITVLTKLLDAQKTPIAPLPKPTNKRNAQIPHTWNLQGKKISAKTSDPDLPATLPGRKLPVWKRKSAPTAVPHTIVPHFYPEQKRSVQVDPLAVFDNTPKPTRFEWPEEELSTLNYFDSSFDDISYTSKPLLTQDDEPRPSTSFDRIKDTPDSSRRSTSYSNATVDMEDVKDYVKEQKIRSNMTEEDDDEAVDNDFDNCDGSSKTNSSQENLKRKIKLECIPAKRVRFNINEKENQIRQTKINITPTGKTSSDVDHTKIISEVLKKYPNLVKKNKNIRLKILAKSNNTPIAAEQVKKPIFKKVSPKIQLQTVTSSPSNITQKLKTEEKTDEDGPWKCLRCSTPTDPVEFVLYYLYRKHMTDVHNEKFDSRMCKFCGHKSTKHNMLMYHQYTKHGVKPPPAYNFPKCSRCPYIALTEALLNRHKMNHTKYELPCVECNVTFTNRVALTSHVQITGHIGKSDKPNYDCQYCTKKFQAGATLFSHIRQQHRDEARRDGIVSIDETQDAEEEVDNLEQQAEEQEEEYITPEIVAGKRDKIKILSDVKLPSMDVQQGSSDSPEQQNIELEPSSEAEALSNVASGIATSLGLVDVVVLDENQQYILHTDNQQAIAGGESEFILPDLQDTQTFTTTQQVIASEQNVITQSMLHNSDIGSTDELVMVLTDHDYGDGNSEIINNENSNIVVLYSHPIEGQENQFITSQGNLMLTSQAGLIELRNGNAVVTSTAPHFITSSTERPESTHIESIEMIQREINQHPNVKNQIQLVQDIKPTLEPEDASSPITVSTEIQQLAEQVVAESSPQNDAADFAVLQETEVHEEVPFNVLDTTVEQTSENEETNETSERLEETEMEVTEEQEVSEANDSIEQPLESSSTCELNQPDSELTQVQFEDTNAETSSVPQEPPNTECVQNKDCNAAEGVKLTEQKNVEENMEVERVLEQESQQSTEMLEETSKPLSETSVTGVVIDNNEKTTEIQPQEEPAETTEFVEEEQITKHPLELEQELHTTTEKEVHDTTSDHLEKIIEPPKSINEEPQQLPLSETDTEKPSASLEAENNSEIPKNQDVETLQTNANTCDENLLIEDENSQSQQQDQNLEPQNQHSQLHDESSQLGNENSQPPEANSQPQNTKLVLDDETSKLQNDNSQLQEEDSHLPDEDSQLENEDAQLQDANTQIQDEIAQLQDENSQPHEENSQLHDENSPLQDENSQTSQTSQYSSSCKPTYSRNNSNQSAKIILDDWEDTDSQQSDSKNGTAVHKLIDDWDDDEEEKKSTV